MCRINFDFNVSCRTGCHVVIQYCKDNGTIALAKESRSHKKSKHIKRWYHIIRDYLEMKYVEVRRVDSTDNMADPLIKQLSQSKIEVHFEKMELRFMANWL